MAEVSGVCCPGRFEGSFSSDGSTLSGNWTSLNRSEPVRQTFRRAVRPQSPTAAAPQARLNPKIPRANGEKYRSIRDAKEWRNPLLTIRADGIEVNAKGLASGRTVAPSDLLRTLVSLPVDAWPYGRVVSASDIGIREPGRDDEPIRRNHEAAEKVLKDLGVVVDWWPSA
jgi:hypothetical protein